ncbi:MAG: hypothetical protein M1354_02060 [Candidatus Marsarchaeota archaeon]|jgi:ribosomal protein S24E|nr:hypothetical protein [Candidatus Marsarchaeota archaeon]
MELKLLEDKENKLFGRHELSIEASYEGKTPTRDEIREGICKKLGLSPDTLDIIRIDQEYGLRVSKITAYSYGSKESMDRFAKKYKEKKPKKPADASPAAAAGAPTAEKKE